MAFVIGVMGWCVFKNPEEKQRRKKLLECPKQKNKVTGKGLHKLAQL